MDIHASDQLGVGYNSQNSGRFKPWRQVATMWGNITDQNKENNILKQPVLNQTSSYLEVAGTNPVYQPSFFYNNVNSSTLYGGKRIVSAVLVDQVIGLIVKKQCPLQYRLGGKEEKNAVGCLD